MKKLALPNFGKIKINVSLLLTIVLFLVLLYEAYLAWQYIFKNLYSGEVSVAPSDIVRVDLNAYQDTLDYLDLGQRQPRQPLQALIKNGLY